MDFSGTAGQIRETFHTEIHNLMVDGTPHIANMSDPQIPAALAPAIAGIVSLHNFWPHPMFRARANYTFTTNGITDFAVVPGDLATTYDLNPLFKAGTTGTGETVVVVEDSNLFKDADWTDFRKTFGLDRFTSGKLTTVHPAPSTGKSNCADPGVNGDSSEATLDAEYSSAVAPNATIAVATCADTATTFGGLIVIENMVGSATPPAIVSMSYGECEALNGAASNATFNSAFQQAVAEGVSVFVSAGDDAAAGCDRDVSAATPRYRDHRVWRNAIQRGRGRNRLWRYLCRAPTRPIGMRPTRHSSNRPSLTYPRFRGTDSCAGVLLSTNEGFSTPLWQQWLLQQHGRAGIPEYNWRQRGTQRMRHGRACVAWGCGRNLQGLPQAIVADRCRRPAVQRGS